MSYGLGVRLKPTFFLNSLPLQCAYGMLIANSWDVKQTCLQCAYSMSTANSRDVKQTCLHPMYHAWDV
jgi:hypothetical protein